MAVVGAVIELVLWLFVVFVLTRLVAEWVQMFARSWTPRGPVLVFLEVVYSVTDPPLRLLRRVIPPLRIGGVAIDLSLLLLLVGCWVLQIVNRSLLPIA